MAALWLWAAPPALAAGPVVDRVISDSRIAESSGLAPSLLRPGVLWTHNDSGNPARIYAIGQDGSTVGTLKISGTMNRDWEAIAGLRDRSGRSLLAIGDIGDNKEAHRSVEIVVVAEPAAGDSQTRPLALLHLRYPDRPVNAEALAVDPTSGRMYLVSKQLLGARVYAVPAAVWPGRSTATGTLEPVGSVPMGLVTDGTFLPDGRMVLRNYSSILVLAPPGEADGGELTVLASQDTPVQDQGESLALTDGGRALLLGSEGKNEPVYRMALPVAVSPSLSGSAGAPPATPGAGSAPPRPSIAVSPAHAGTASGAASRSGGSGPGGTPLWLAPMLAAGATGLAFAGAVVVSRRRRRSLH